MNEQLQDSSLESGTSNSEDEDEESVLSTPPTALLPTSITGCPTRNTSRSVRERVRGMSDDWGFGFMHVFPWSCDKNPTEESGIDQYF